jgi:SAM-dependent MidA family methyltransferase
VDLLRAEIDAHGPITFARFMRRALYEPGLGYYAVSRTRPTRDGDFLTAPELHSIFGRAVAAQVGEMWQRLGKPADFVVREYGAGRGALAGALPHRFRFEPVEAGDERPSQPMVGVILANEFLDALPVHRVIVEGGQLRELYVGWAEGRFTQSAGELSDVRLAGWFGDRQIVLAEGQIAEVNLKMVDWLAEVSALLERGYVLVFDYGLPATELYGPERLTGTLRAFRSHHVSSDALGGVGRQDLTAHVDLDALVDGAKAAGLDVIGRHRPSSWLATAWPSSSSKSVPMRARTGPGSSSCDRRSAGCSIRATSAVIRWLPLAGASSAIFRCAASTSSSPVADALRRGCAAAEHAAQEPAAAAGGAHADAVADN